MPIIPLLVALILIGLVFWASRAIAAAFAIPAPIMTVIQVILVVIVVVWLLGAFGLISGPFLRLR